MQVGEAVDDEVVVEQHDEDCYFCNATQEAEENENDLNDALRGGQGYRRDGVGRNQVQE